jgi:hypothetical protein
MIESWNTWERETLAEQDGDFAALLHDLAARREAVEADHPHPGPPGGAETTAGRSGTGHPPPGRPKLRIV